MLEQSYVKFGTLTTRTYDVTFSAGTLGINLLATRAGFGGYVDTFYRPQDGAILYAEQSGLIKRGDLILEINGEDVSRIQLNELPKKIEKAKRPIVVKFESVSMDLTFPDVVSDPRKMPWFMQYLVETYGVEEAVTEQAKLMLWLECEAYRENIASIPEGDYSDQEMLIFKKFFREDSNFSLLYHIPDNLRHLIFAALTALGIVSSRENGITSPNNNLPSPNTATLMSHFAKRKGFGSQLLADAQHWVEDDMTKGSFRNYLGSDATARMVGYLRYSPPFVKMSLMDVLKCDRKSMYFVVFLCQIKRHAAIHCNCILRPRPDDYPEGTVGHAEDILRKAMACVHVLGLQEGRAGIEDLPMLNALKMLLPDLVELPGILHAPSPTEGFPAQSGRNLVSLADPFIDSLNSAITLSIPISNELKSMARDSSKKVQEIKQRLHELRLAMLRELSTELMPKFLASKEFEVLLWEIEAHRQFTAAERASTANTFTREVSEDGGSASETETESRSEGSVTRGGGDEDSLSLGSLGTIGEEDSKENSIGVVPDGAVQRLLRKVNLPASMTMHRAPLSLLDEARDENRRKELDATAWIVALDTHGTVVRSKEKYRERDKPTPRASNITTRGDLFQHDNPSQGQVQQELKIDYILPVGMEKGIVPNLDTTIVPSTLPSFLIPSGKFVWDANDRSPPPSTRLFNLVVSTRDNVLLYVSALVLFRPMQEDDIIIHPDTRERAFSTPVKNWEKDTKREHSTPTTAISKQNSAAIQLNSSNLAFRTPTKGMTSFDSSILASGNTPIKVTPKNSSMSEYNGTKINMLLGLGDKDNPPRPLLGRMNGALSPIVMRGKSLVSGVLRVRTTENSNEMNSSSSSATSIASQSTLSSTSQSTVATVDVGVVSVTVPAAVGGPTTLSVETANVANTVGEKADGGISISSELTSRDDGGAGTGTGVADVSSSPTPELSSNEAVISTSPTPMNLFRADSPVPASEKEGSKVLVGEPTSPHRRTRSGGSSTAPVAFDQLPFTSPADFLGRNGSSKETGSVAVEDDTSSKMSRQKERESGQDLERRVPYALCLVTKTPCIDALRLPLALLARRPEVKLSDLPLTPVSSTNQSRPVSPTATLTLSHSIGANEAGSTEGDSVDIPEGERRALIALSLIEEEDSLRLLRQCASNCPRAAVPAVLRPDGAHDMDMEMIFRALNPRNIVTILIAFMLEFKVAIVSSKLTALTVLGETLKTLIAPLRWSHIYVPVLPKNMSAELLQCPTPFFVGMLRENFETSTVPADVCLLDLENDACRVPTMLGKALYAGRRLARSLDELMRPALFRCDDIEPLGGAIPSTSNGPPKVNAPRHGGAFVRDIIRLCKVFVADVLEGIDECSIHCIDHSEVVVLFDEAMFCSHKLQRAKYSEFPGDKIFLEQLMRTQCFSMCIGGSILKRLDPHSRPPSRPSSPYLAMAPLQENSDSSSVQQYV